MWRMQSNGIGGHENKNTKRCTSGSCVTVHIDYNVQQQLQMMTGDTGTPINRACEVE